MDEYLKEALDIVKAQAGVREMSEGEITDMVVRLSAGVRRLAEGGAEAAPVPAVDPKRAIREKTVINLEDGKAYKVLTRKTLARFGLTPEEYREKWGYAKGAPLVCKGLARERRKKMKEMELWKRRKKKGGAKKK